MTERTYAGTLTKENIDEKVLIKGWVQKRRDLGGLIFIDLRDRSGIVQVVFNPETSEEAIKIADTVRNEYVIQVHGQVVKREESTVNHDMKTGTIEIIADQIDVLNKSKNPPF